MKSAGRVVFFAVFAMFVLAHGATALADDGWVTVARDQNRQVQIDRGGIFQSDADTRVAWARMILGADEAAAVGYAMIHALNRYDCRNRSFQTMKRRYLDAANNVVGDEDVREQRSIAVTRSGVDERLWREVCRPPSSSDLSEVARRAERAAAALGSAPQPQGR